MKELFRAGTVVTLQTMESEEINRVGQGWEIRWHRLRPEGVRVALRAFHTPRIQYADAYYSSDYLMQGLFPRGTVLLALVRGDGSYSAHNRLISPYELIVMKPGDEIDLLTRGAHAILTLAVESSLFHQCFRRYFGCALSDSGKRGRLFMHPLHLELYVQQMSGWMAFFRQHASVYTSAPEFDIAEKNILFSFFSLLHREGKTERSRARFDMRKARDLIHQHLCSHYTVSDLAEEMGVSIRTLQHNFRRKLGILPKEYLNKLRLNAIRDELSRHGRDKSTVRQIALRYGFRHLGHFIHQYRELFGETPAQTLRRTHKRG